MEDYGFNGIRGRTITCIFRRKPATHSGADSYRQEDFFHHNEYRAHISAAIACRTASYPVPGRGKPSNLPGIEFMPFPSRYFFTHFGSKPVCVISVCSPLLHTLALSPPSCQGISQFPRFLRLNGMDVQGRRIPIQVEADGPICVILDSAIRSRCPLAIPYKFEFSHKIDPNWVHIEPW